MFEKTLTDVVKGIRSCKRDTAGYISKCIAEIKEEIKSSDPFVKANALQKITFFQMMGYSMGYASFATIEVMSAPRFAHKRIGYLAASQGFTQETDVILLTTNLLKKELQRAVGGGMQGVYEAGLAINCISNIVTEELAQDLLPELTSLTTHPQPYLRKQAILCLYKLFVKYPQGLRLTFPKLHQSLGDSNSSVTSCAVNVITELSDKNPKNYLHLAPDFFKILTQSTNNWMLIKVVKLLASLVPEEPRLARKLLDPLVKIVQTTQAKSLLYESVLTITMCLPYCRKDDGSLPEKVPGIVDQCADTLFDFVEQPDQNLKYLGLIGFGSLLQSQPHVLRNTKYQPNILACLSDEDVTIRRRALDLLVGMATPLNVRALVTQLMNHIKLATGQYKLDLVEKVIDICSGDKYSRQPDFGWYLDLLFRIGHMRGTEKHGDLLRVQISDVALRVEPIREYAVMKCTEILLSINEISSSGYDGKILPQVLPAMAWIIGEYSDSIPNAMNQIKSTHNVYQQKVQVGIYCSLICFLTNPNNSQKIATETQKIYVQASMKVLAAASANKKTTSFELEQCMLILSTNLPVFLQSIDVEVVERSFVALELLKSLDLYSDNSSYELNTNAKKSNEEDLLGMTSPSPDEFSETKITTQSNAAKLREVSELMSLLLKPHPMKPLGPKAQRRQHQELIDGVDLSSPADLSLFQQQVAEEIESQNIPLSTECVTFTQQIPFVDVTVRSTPPSVNDQHTTANGQTTEDIQRNGRVRQDDPFYLDPGKGNNNVWEDGAESGAPLRPRLDIIQLESDDQSRSRKDHKKRKKKKKSSSTNHIATDSRVGDDWRRGDISSKPSTVIAVYGSDEEDDDTKNKHLRAKRSSREYRDLSRVDITQPLAEDEVMPERKHRSTSASAHGTDTKPHRSSDHPREKKAKKSKKKKKKSSQTNKDSAIATTQDLLDLGAVSQSTNAINDAFDGMLLDLTTNSP